MSNGTVEAVAEVIEAEGATGLAVEFSPAVIDANFDALEERVRALVADYEGASYDMSDAENVRAAKRDRGYLNGIAKQIDERRKAVKREYNKPLEAFEARCRQVSGIAKQAADAIKEQLDAAEEERRERAYAALEEHYEGYAGLLAPVVPYERLHDPKWLNKTFGEQKAREALEEKVSAVARDWDALKARRDATTHYEEAEREFFRTLDLGAALSAARRADEEDARIAELRAAVEPGPDEAPEVVMEGGPNGGEGPLYAPEPIPNDAAGSGFTRKL